MCKVELNMNKKLYCFLINPSTSLDEAWHVLEQAGVEIAYGSEEDNKKFIYGYWNSSKQFPEILSVSKMTLTELPSIDWELQWETHGLNFYDGHVHVDLEQFGSSKPSTLRLQPGPGFGDLSHPTTHLVLHLMSHLVPDHLFIDIGCGSGILTLAAVEMGATSAYGIEIDPQALEHAQLNAQLNGLEKKCHFYLTHDFKMKFDQPVVMAMNMISSEQQEAWLSLSSLHDQSGILITSGIRVEERSKYLRMAKEWGWSLTKEVIDGEWVAFQFLKNVS